MFELAENEIKFLYNSNKMSDRETYAYISAAHEHVINELDVYKNDLTPTQITELAQKLNIRIIDLFDRNSEYFRENIEGKDLQEEDLLTILVREKSALVTPIAITREGAKIIDSSSETINIDMIFKRANPGDDTKFKTNNS